MIWSRLHVSLIRRYRSVMLASLFFFYVGCGLTISFLRLECDALYNLDTIRDTPEFSKIEYAVVILSGPNNVVKRDAIRATWGKFVSNIFIENGEKLYKWNHSWTTHSIPQEHTKLFFVIGTKGLSELEQTKLDAEDNRNNDLLLLEGFEDSYKNLAPKILYTLKWFSNSLSGMKYLIKCDDDSFVRVDLIVKELEAFGLEMTSPEITEYVSHKEKLEKKSTYNGLYWGYFDGRARVYLSGKWQEQDWFLCDNYLPYALGGGYIISRSIIDYISTNADLLSHYKSEDVSMGVWTAPLKSINRVHDTRFDTEWKSRGCSNSMLVRHKQSPSDMFQLYKTLVHTHGERLCKTEVAERKSYKYNWNVQPSMCCSFAVIAATNRNTSSVKTSTVSITVHEIQPGDRQT